jgi:prepilin-type N-terminal cleavage/methylation domain-containing protein
MKPLLVQEKSGFSLVELLVAIFIGVILVMAVYSLFIMQNQSYINQNRVAEMQQNVRMAMSILSTEFRMAGFGFSIDGDYKTTSATVAYAVTPTNSSTGPDSVTLRYGINPTTLTTAIANSTGSTMVVSNTNGFAPNDYIIVSDGQNASRLRVTSVNSGTSLSFTPVSPNIFPTGGFGVGSRVYKLKQTSYRISNNTLQVQTDGVTWQDLVNEIEDLQLGYQGTTTPSGTWLDNPNPVNQTTITGVQINILARPNDQDLQFTGQRPIIRDHAAGSSDHYRRRLLTSTIRIRNL